MMIKVFTKDKDGKISFTEDELKKLLDEAYWEGYNTNHNYIYHSPSISPSITPMWYSTTTKDTVTLTCNNNSVRA